MHFADAVFTNAYLLGQRHCNLFQRRFKNPNVNLVMEQPFCSVEPTDASRTSKIQTKLGRLLHLNVDI